MLQTFEFGGPEITVADQWVTKYEKEMETGVCLEDLRYQYQGTRSERERERENEVNQPVTNLEKEMETYQGGSGGSVLRTGVGLEERR